MQRLEKQELHVHEPINVCCKARIWAKEEINGRVKYEFDILFDYATALRQADPNCNVDLMVVRPSPSHPKIFRKIYICFGEKKGIQKLLQANPGLRWLFLERLGELQGKALETLLLKDPIHWSRAFFATHCHSDVDDNNSAEAFNAAILQSRYMSIISMLDYIRHYVMNIIVANKAITLSWKSMFGPKIMGKITSNRELSSYCHVNWNGAEGYEVVCGQDMYVVDINGRKCSFKAWDLTGTPCPHVICAILFRKESVEDYVLTLYTKEVNEQIYSCVLHAFPGDKLWPRKNLGPLCPPIEKKMPGRPKKNRRREECETSCGTRLSKRGCKQRCQLCFKQGHNSRKCPTRQKPQQTAPNFEKESNTPEQSQTPHPTVTVSQRKSSRIANLSPKSKSKALGACSTREVNDVKGKGKAKEQPRTQAIRPMRKLQFPNTKDKFQKRKQPWK
ncbi:hypothetical protein V6N13_092836 [Hibiscus sabdariffa]